MIKTLNILIRFEIAEIRRLRSQALTLEKMEWDSCDPNFGDVARSYWSACSQHRGALIAYRNVRKILRASEKTSALDRAESLMPDWPAKHPESPAKQPIPTIYKRCPHSWPYS